MRLFLIPLNECTIATSVITQNQQNQQNQSEHKVIENVRIDRYQRTPEQVFQQLRDLIVKMTFKPGERVSEQEIAKRFGVSRTPVREAIIQLSHLGLVKVLPQRGTFISKFQRDFLLEAVFIRKALEEAVIFEVAKNVDSKLIDTAQKLIAKQKKAAKTDDISEFKLFDDQFHMGFAQATGFNRIGSLIEAEKYHMDRLRYLGLAELQGEYTRVIAQHQAVLDAVAAGNPEAAVHAIKTHIQSIVTTINLAWESHPDYFDGDNTAV